MSTVRTILVVERVVEVEIEGLAVGTGPEAQAALDVNGSYVRDIAIRTAQASGQIAPGDTVRLIRATIQNPELTP